MTSHPYAAHSATMMHFSILYRDLTYRHRLTQRPPQCCICNPCLHTTSAATSTASTSPIPAVQEPRSGNGCIASASIRHHIHSVNSKPSSQLSHTAHFCTPASAIRAYARQPLYQSTSPRIAANSTTSTPQLLSRQHLNRHRTHNVHAKTSLPTASYGTVIHCHIYNTCLHTITATSTSHPSQPAEYPANTQPRYIASTSDPTTSTAQTREHHHSCLTQPNNPKLHPPRVPMHGNTASAALILLSSTSQRVLNNATPPTRLHAS